MDYSIKQFNYLNNLNRAMKIGLLDRDGGRAPKQGSAEFRQSSVRFSPNNEIEKVNTNVPCKPCIPMIYRRKVWLFTSYTNLNNRLCGRYQFESFIQ